MYFKIEKTGCAERKGLVQVRFDLYLDKSDADYNKHYIQVPVIPTDGYPGDKDKEGNPLDYTEYEKWINGLKKIWQHNPFCCHFCQFEPDVTDEEILYVGELALDMAGKNYQNLKQNKNIPVKFSDDGNKKSAASGRVAVVVDTDFTKLITIGNYRVK